MCHYDYRFLCLILLTAKIYYRLYPCPDKLEHAYVSVFLKETFVTTTSYEHNWREIRYIKNGRHALVAIHWNFYLSVFLKNPFLTVENVSKIFFFWTEIIHITNQKEVKRIKNSIMRNILMVRCSEEIQAASRRF